MPYNLNMENIIIHNRTRDMLLSISSTILHVRYSEHANSKSVQSSPIWRYSKKSSHISPLRAGLGSIHFFQFNSIPIQVGFGIFQFNSIPIQIGFRIFQFNSNSIHFHSIQIQILCTVVNKSIRKHFKTGSFKFNLSIPLFAAQFRKYMQDHNKSRIN